MNVKVAEEIVASTASQSHIEFERYKKGFGREGEGVSEREEKRRKKEERKNKKEIKEKKNVRKKIKKK